MLVLNIKRAKLGFFKNAYEVWSLVFVENEWDLGLCLLLAVQKITAQLCKCGAEAAALCKTSWSRGADPGWDRAVRGSWTWMGSVEKVGVESRAGSAESGRAGQRSGWQTARVKSGWFMEQFLLKASSCTLGSGAARLVKLQCPDSLNWLPAAGTSAAKLEQPLPPAFAGCHIGAAARQTDSVKMLRAMRTFPWQR